MYNTLADILVWKKEIGWVEGRQNNDTDAIEYVIIKPPWFYG